MKYTERLATLERRHEAGATFEAECTRTADALLDALDAMDMLTVGCVEPRSPVERDDMLARVRTARRESAR